MRNTPQTRFLSSEIHTPAPFVLFCCRGVSHAQHSWAVEIRGCRSVEKTAHIGEKLAWACSASCAEIRGWISVRRFVCVFHVRVFVVESFVAASRNCELTSWHCDVLRPTVPPIAKRSEGFFINVMGTAGVRARLSSENPYSH